MPSRSNGLTTLARLLYDRLDYNTILSHLVICVTENKTAYRVVVTVAVGAGTVGRMGDKPKSFHEMTAEFYCGIGGEL
jgi:hypothetical protein